ncbi:UDP-N-acetylglucosamine transferase subunit ALG13 -like protein [Babesia sp. Xinjiang]|uniref:UDP-N-acetylglucosamine transferase subunit ALG13 -like protein n=1 Tax=Babesia sp. Xinjiang TaxID=462227 RepID=UPI000A24129C|nr:UDP-N-acetylglucosamine transferase subunit ALG13 -like protein [Babesia sp. Xinjiang]ORM41735.1 UDP-N-acetylglucosamine transferase subunit ALG13 -like protein [Babesia sp. Xinjiang]
MVKQVLVTVGTTSFDDLILAVDNIELQLELKRLGYTDICYQIGASALEIKNKILNTKVLRFEQDFDNVIQRSELIISHMGAGTIIDVFRLRKKAIFVPNRKVAADHQMQLFRVMDERYRATLDNLKDKLKTATETTGPFFNRILPPGPLNEVIEDTLSQ